jgi:hypothetical protein
MIKNKKDEFRIEFKREFREWKLSIKERNGLSKNWL